MTMTKTKQSFNPWTATVAKQLTSDPKFKGSKPLLVRVGATTFCIMMLSLMTLGIMTLGIMTLSI